MLKVEHPLRRLETGLCFSVTQWWGRCAVWKAVGGAVEAGVSDAAADGAQRLWPAWGLLLGPAGGKDYTLTETPSSPAKQYTVHSFASDCSSEASSVFTLRLWCLYTVVLPSALSFPGISSRSWLAGQLLKMKRRWMKRSWTRQPWHFWRRSSSWGHEQQGEADDWLCSRCWLWWWTLCIILCCWEKAHRWVKRRDPEPYAVKPHGVVGCVSVFTALTRHRWLPFKWEYLSSSKRFTKQFIGKARSVFF